MPSLRCRCNPSLTAGILNKVAQPKCRLWWFVFNRTQISSQLGLSLLFRYRVGFRARRVGTASRSLQADISQRYLKQARHCHHPPHCNLLTTFNFKLFSHLQHPFLFLSNPSPSNLQTSWSTITKALHTTQPHQAATAMQISWNYSNLSTSHFGLPTLTNTKNQLFKNGSLRKKRIRWTLAFSTAYSSSSRSFLVFPTTTLSTRWRIDNLGQLSNLEQFLVFNESN